MAKLTVYIPDDLLDRARALDPGANTSQLVQRGLERLSPASSVAYAQRPADADALLAAAADQLRAGAAQEYERGYRAALGTVAKAGEVLWSALEGLARNEFDLLRWAAAVREGLGHEATFGTATTKPGFNPPEWFEPMASDLGSLLDPIGFDEWSFTPTRAFVRGYEAALHDAWDVVERPVSPDRNDPDAETEKEVPNPDA